MDERVRRLEAAIEAVQTTVTSLESRIAALEHGDRSAPVIVDPNPDGEVFGSEIDRKLAVVLGTPTLVGRSLLVLAGAFLFRALTERGVFSPAVGVAMGLAYAAVWVLVAASAARKKSPASAGFFAACSAVIAGPLLFEAATSFGVLSPTAAAVALVGVTSAGLYVSVRWRLRAPAWVFTIACVVTAAAVATARPPGEAATAVVVLLGVATLWFARDLGWIGLQWLTAFTADLAVFRLTTIATVAGDSSAQVGSVPPTFAATIQAVLLIGYVGTFVVRSLRGKAPIGVFEFAQTAAVWVVGWGGALRLADANGWPTGVLAFLALACGVAAYACAFGAVDRKQGRNVAFYYLSSLGLGLVLVGMPAFAGAATAVVWASLAVAAAAVGSRWDRVTLRVHAAILVGAAWVAAGVASNAVVDLGGDGMAAGTSRAEAVVVVILTLLTTAVVIIGRRSRSAGWVHRLPLAFLLLVSAAAIAAAIVEAVVAVLPPGSAFGNGTVALSMVTVGLALLARRWGIAEAGWLVYPFLLLTGLRMIAREFLSGQTLVLVIALAAYGFALIVSTKMVGVGIGAPDGDPSASG